MEASQEVPEERAKARVCGGQHGQIPRQGHPQEVRGCGDAPWGCAMWLPLRPFRGSLQQSSTLFSREKDVLHRHYGWRLGRGGCGCALATWPGHSRMQELRGSPCTQAKTQEGEKLARDKLEIIPVSSPSPH